MKNIAIIAHDSLKPAASEFLKDKKDWIATVNLLATGRTADYLEKSGVEIRHMSPGRSGGYRQIIDMVDSSEVDIVFFFMDPKVERPYHQDMEDLLDICITKNIPVALNPESAQLLILGMYKYESYLRHISKKEK